MKTKEKIKLIKKSAGRLKTGPPKIIESKKIKARKRMRNVKLINIFYD